MQLGASGHAISSDVALLEGGSVAVGPEVDDLRVTDPARLVPRVIDRVGDPITIVSGQDQLSGQDLVAQLVVWVAQQVADAEQADAQTISVTVPAAWGTHRRGLLLEALADAGLPDILLVSEPEAAVARYVDRHAWSDTAIIAVVGIGASALRAAVVRGDGRDQQVLGVPDGYDGASGRAFDDAMTRHVATALGVTLPTLGGVSRDDDSLAAALVIPDDAAAELRGLCIEAKELLSIDTHVTIEPTAISGARVRIVRSELEALIRKPVIASVDALRRTVRSAGLSPEDIATVLLVGGSAQVPLVAEVFSTEFGRPVEVDPDPSYALALGAARLAGDAAGAPLEYDDSDLEDDEAPSRSFVLPWRRPRKPAVLVAAACVLALMSAGGLVAATANENPSSSEKRPSRAVNLTTGPSPTPGVGDLAVEPSESPSATDTADPEGARSETSAGIAGTYRPGTSTSSRPSTAPAEGSSSASAPGTTPAAVITPVTSAVPVETTPTAPPADPTSNDPTSPSTSTSTPSDPPSSTSTSIEPPPTSVEPPDEPAADALNAGTSPDTSS